MSHFDDLPRRDGTHELEEAAIVAFQTKLAETGLFIFQGADRKDYGTDRLPDRGDCRWAGDHALAETVNGLFKAEVIHRRARGAVPRRWNSPRLNGSTGSTIGACSNRSEISRPQKPKRAIMPRPMSAPWWRDSNQTASGKPGAIQG
jgi:hypothetical protein